MTSIPDNIRFPSVERYQAYLESIVQNEKDPAELTKKKDVLTTNMAILPEALVNKAGNDGAGWDTVGIGHSLDHDPDHRVFDRAGVSWNKFVQTGSLSNEEARQLFIRGDYERFKAVAVKNLDGSEPGWFDKQPRNFQDAVVLEVFNKGELGFFHKAKADHGYEENIVDEAKIAKLKSSDPKQIFEAFTTGQSVSATKKELEGGHGDTVREALASRRPFSGALAIAHFTEDKQGNKLQSGIVPTSYLDAMANDQLLKDVGMTKEDIIARSVKYANTRDKLKLDGTPIPEGIGGTETQYAYNGSNKKTKSYAPTKGSKSINDREEEYYPYDIADLLNSPMGIFALIAMMFMNVSEGKPVFSGLENFGSGGGHSSVGGSDGNGEGNPYKGNFELGGVSQKYNFKLPEAGVNEPAADYYARAAKSFAGIHEQGYNDGPFVNWVMEKAGCEGQGAPWCAGFASKIYEGTGLFKYTPAAIGFANQAQETGSFRAGISNIDGIEKSDPIVFSRVGGNHVGVVVDVKREGSRVTSITTIEGNSGDKVNTRTYTPNQLAQAGNYLGYADIKDIAQKRNINLDTQLAGKYHSNDNIQVADNKLFEKAPAKAEIKEPAVKNDAAPSDDLHRAIEAASRLKTGYIEKGVSKTKEDTGVAEQVAQNQHLAALIDMHNKKQEEKAAVAKDGLSPVSLAKNDSKDISVNSNKVSGAKDLPNIKAASLSLA